MLTGIVTPAVTVTVSGFGPETPQLGAIPESRMV
jgi:hypothetical protein